MKKLLALALTSALPAFAAAKKRVIVCYRNRNHSCRNFPMTRLAIFCLLLFLAPATVPAQETDPIREALTRAIQNHKAATVSAKAVVTGEIDARIKATAATGNLDAVLKLVAEKKAYVANGTLPAWLATVPQLKSLPKSLMEADARLKAAYKNAEIAYTKALQLDKADAVRDELTNLAGAAAPAPNVGAGSRAEIIFEDFEDGTYARWKVEGEAFGTAPAAGSIPGQAQMDGFLGRRLLNSMAKGDGPKGVLRSRSFRIERTHIRFLLGGGGSPEDSKERIVLRLGDREVRKAAGKNSEQLNPIVWDVREFAGQTASIEIIDDESGGWGHILVDHIVFTDSPDATGTP